MLHFLVCQSSGLLMMLNKVHCCLGETSSLCATKDAFCIGWGRFGKTFSTSSVQTNHVQGNCILRSRVCRIFVLSVSGCSCRTVFSSWVNQVFEVAPSVKNAGRCLMISQTVVPGGFQLQTRANYVLHLTWFPLPE